MVKKDTFPRGTAVTAVEILVFNTRHHAGEPGSMEQATGGEPGFIKQWQRMGPGREWAGRSWEAVWRQGIPSCAGDLCTGCRTSVKEGLLEKPDPQRR